MKNRRLLSLALLAGGVVVFAWLLRESWPTIEGMAAGAAWYAVASSVFLLVLANTHIGIVFASLVGRFGAHRLRARRVVGVFLASQVAKYVPGRVWGVAMQAAMLRAVGSTPAVVAANVELSVLVLIVVSGVGMACLCAAIVGPWVGVAVLLATFGASLLLLKLDGAARLVRFVARIMPVVSRLVPNPGQDSPVSGGIPWKATHASLAVYMLLYLAGWWLLVVGASRFDAQASLMVVAAMSLSYIIGMLSMLPGGLGAREGAMVLLAPAMGLPQGEMAALAVVSRAAILVVDALAAAIGAWVLRKDYF